MNAETDAPQADKQTDKEPHLDAEVIKKLKSLVHKLRAGCDDKTLVELYTTIEKL